MWTCDRTVEVGPVVIFVNEQEFVVAHLDGHLYYCAVGESGIEMREAKAFMDFEGQIVVEGNREWSKFS